MKEYKTIIHEIDSDNPISMFDAKINELTSKGWVISGQLQTSTLDKGSFLGHYPNTVITQRLEREITESTKRSDAEEKSERLKQQELADAQYKSIYRKWGYCIYAGVAFFIILYLID